VRVRTTAAAVAVVGLALVVAAIGMVLMLRRSLTADVHLAARLRASDLADLLASGTPAHRLVVGRLDEAFVQVVDGGGKVIASSRNLEASSPVAELPLSEPVQLADPTVDDEPFLVVAAIAEAQGGRVTVLVGQTLETVAESTQVVTSLLGLGLPLLLLVVGATTWRVVGRALAPVEAIRAEVDAISAAELHRRVPDPPGKDEIAGLATTMNAMLARLQESQARQRRFVSDASHELRSPVAAIRQHAEVASAHPERTTAGELAEVVLEENLRVQRLVEDLLLLARVDERTLRLGRSSVDLDDLVFEQASRLRDTSGLTMDVTGVSAGRVVGDAAQLRRLVRNLTDNAARHARSAMALSLSQSNGEVLLRVDDDGAGIPAPERGRVFERFVRLDDARTRDAGGSGLGLAIVAEVAAAHGGSVRVSDSPLGGARLEVHLPGEGA